MIPGDIFHRLYVVKCPRLFDYVVNPIQNISLQIIKGFQGGNALLPHRFKLRICGSLECVWPLFKRRFPRSKVDISSSFINKECIIGFVHKCIVSISLWDLHRFAGRYHGFKLIDSILSNCCKFCVIHCISQIFILIRIFTCFEIIFISSFKALGFLVVIFLRRLFQWNGTLFGFLTNAGSHWFCIFVLLDGFQWWPRRFQSFARFLRLSIIKITSECLFHLGHASTCSVKVWWLERLVAFFNAPFECSVDRFWTKLFFRNTTQTYFMIWDFWISPKQFLYESHLQIKWMHIWTEIFCKVP